MWKWVTGLNKLWGTIGAVTAIFTLGGGTAVFYFERFEEKGQSVEIADGVHRRVDDLVSRFTNLSTWVREQVAELRGRQDASSKEVADQYRAVNQRLDMQSLQLSESNRLMVEMIKTVNEMKKQDHGDAGGWSLIDTARAANRRAMNN